MTPWHFQSAKALRTSGRPEGAASGRGRHRLALETMARTRPDGVGVGRDAAGVAGPPYDPRLAVRLRPPSVIVTHGDLADRRRV